MNNEKRLTDSIRKVIAFFFGLCFIFTIILTPLAVIMIQNERIIELLQEKARK